jgi:hypothetical protein
MLQQGISGALSHFAGTAAAKSTSKKRNVPAEGSTVVGAKAEAAATHAEKSAVRYIVFVGRRFLCRQIYVVHAQMSNAVGSHGPCPTRLSRVHLVMAALRTWEFPTGCRALAAGQNSSGELGLGHAQNVVRDFAPLLPPGRRAGGGLAPALFGAASCGGGYTLLYDEENVATLACGEQDGGSSGLAKPQRVLAPLPALRGVRIRALASGLSHSLALAEDGRVFAWGRNADGKTAIRPVQRLPCATRVACTMNI